MFFILGPCEPLIPFREECLITRAEVAIEDLELFDLKNDPDEMKSVYGNPDYAKVQARLLQELKRLKKEYEVPAMVYQSHKEIQAMKKKGD